MNFELAHEALASLIPAFENAWRYSHENYIYGGGQNFFLNKRTELPEVLCTDMCRQTSFAMQIILKAVDDTGWRVTGGYIKDTKLRPDIAGQKDMFREWHCDVDGSLWLQHWWLQKNGVLLDMTPGAFGYAPIHIGWVDDFPQYQPDAARSLQRYLSNMRTIVIEKWLAEPDYETWNVFERDNAVREGFVSARANFGTKWAIAMGNAPSASIAP